ncbi:cupin domain-containing protein [Fodinibius saliphilus]|uniref:cupin domain-containing protein n=1 Tax=Fodinibius saliphilus TaxID=1920650 RepID=UPI00110912D7|nr:cupin domain-containing protein [Fodinibius saliphilus]
MSQRRIKPGEVINLYDLNDEFPEGATLALMKTSDMEAIRMVLPKGKEVTEHSVDGEVSVQCLEGKTEFIVDGETKVLSKGDWLYLSRHQPHSLNIIEDTVLLVTILFVGSSSEEE